MTKELLEQGLTIVVDKPLGWTSFDVVNKIRWNLKQGFNLKKIKVGHAGTLDPLATGVLVICIGKHTKRIDELMAGVKEYTGKMILGKTTPSHDLETEFESLERDASAITLERVKQATHQFIGILQQIPPIFSAKQVDGKRAYDLARMGQQPELKASAVEVIAFEVESIDLPYVSFRITCSKGTYIRSLVRDVGEELCTGATLVELRRVRSGGQNIEEAKSVEQWLEIIQTKSF